MQLRRNEILTGILVVATVAVLTGVLILLGAPGLFKPLVTYRIYIDNAAGIKLGAPVLLAGRKIGQVSQLYSPISKAEEDKVVALAKEQRPPDATADANAPKPRFEARIDVLVDKKASVYTNAHTRLITLGLLGETAIDITQGTEEAGLASNGNIFAGERVPEFGETIAKVIDILQPVAKEATTTLKELQTTAANLGKITDESSQLNMTIAQMRTFAENLTTMTSVDSPLQLAIKNVETISGNLNKISGDIAGNDNISVTLANFRQSSEKLKGAMNELTPDLKATGENVKDLTETVKRQPWRLIWPSTKEYPQNGPPAAAQNNTGRQSARRQKPVEQESRPKRNNRREVLYPGG